MRKTVALVLVAGLVGQLHGVAVPSELQGRGTDSSPCHEQSGQWYCSPVGTITYKNLGHSGSYNAVVGMDMTSGACNFSPFGFEGALAPFGEPLSIHFRGPVALKKAAVYIGKGNNATANGDGTAKKRAESHLHQHQAMRHQHHPMLHKGHRRAQKKRDVVVDTTTVVATVFVTEDLPQTTTLQTTTAAPTDGAIVVVETVVVWETVTVCPADQTSSDPGAVFGPSTTLSTPSASDVVTTSSPIAVAQPTSSSDSGLSTALLAIPSQSAFPNGAAPGSSGGPEGPGPSPAVDDYSRVGYYNAAEQLSQGMVFLNNLGGQGSGAWTSTFGNTLSYADANGTGCASSKQILKDAVVPSNHEFAIFSDEECDSTCGFVEKGSVAYKGFGHDGVDKVFVFEFSMPHDNEASPTSQSPDMPALWLLNSRIPYTGQYSACNCWATGCGEIDIFEVLSPGNTKCKATVHSSYSSGDSNYFPRPIDDAVTVAVVFDSASNSVVIRMLYGDNADVFGPGLTSAQVQAMLQDTSSIPGLLSSSRVVVPQP